MHLGIDGGPVQDSHRYWALKEEVILAEQSILRAIAFDTNVPQPQVLLLNYLRLVEAPHAVCVLAVAILNDGTSDEVCAAHPGRELVAGAMGLAAEALGIPLVSSWRLVLEVDDAAYDCMCHALLSIYEGAEREVSIR